MKLFRINLLILHGLLGFVLWEFPFLTTYIGIVTILVGTYYILSKPDPLNQFPLMFSAYIVGIEVLLRMTGASLFWEFGKYSVIYFLLLGIIRRRKSLHIYFPILWYFILLLPSILLVPFNSFSFWRQDVAFNLSGPATLSLCSIYFYNRTITREMLKNIIVFMILPIISMSIYNIFMMPDLATYNFQPYSNPSTSGGYGPNQVSTIFGLGIVGILIAQVLKLNLFGSKYINMSLLAFFIGLGLITFSRGGIFAAVISFILAISYYMLYDQKKMYIISKGFGLIIITMITWYAIVSVTDGVISERYGLGKTSYGERILLDLTGRARIYEIDINIFYDHLFTGVGPGQAVELREFYGYGKKVLAHTEYSRMLAEHGLLGLFSLLILFTVLIINFKEYNLPSSKFIKILFGLLALLTLSHSAMRVAMPSFIFGLIFPKYEE